MRSSVHLWLAFFWLGATPSFAQAPEFNVSEAEINGAVVTFSTSGTWGTSTNSNGRRVQRILINHSTGIYVGYAFTVEPLGDSTKLKVIISPLPEEAIEWVSEKAWMKEFQKRWPNRTSFEPSPLPRFPEPQVIDVTEVIKLPLWINPETGAQMGDEIRFALPRLKPVRDFDLDEVKLKFSRHRLIINGEARSGSQSQPDLIGPLPFFSVPGRGRFILSLFPHAGSDFKKIGVVDNNKIYFSYGGDNYEWVSQQPVLNRYDKWHLWVLHDESFQPHREALDPSKSNDEGTCCVFGVLANGSMLPGAKR